MISTNVSRVGIAFFFIAALPALAGWLTVDPSIFWRTGVANYAMAFAPVALALALRGAPAAPMARGGVRQWRIAVLIIGFAIWGAFAIAPDDVRALLALWTILVALLTGYLTARAQSAFGPRVAETFAWAALIAAPLYVTCLPVMDMLYTPEAEPYAWISSGPGFRNIRKIGHLLTISGLAGLALMVIRPSWALALLMVFIFAMIGWTGGRGAIVSVVAAYAFSLVVTGRAGQWRNWAQGAGLLAIGLAASIQIPIPEGAWQLGIENEFRIMRAGVADLSSGRYEMWQGAWEGARALPLTGLGWGQYPYLRDAVPVSHVHNVVLDVLLGLGLGVGSIALFMLLRVGVMVQFARDDAHLPALMIFNGMACYALISGTYFYGVPQTFTAMAAGLCLGAMALRRA